VSGYPWVQLPADVGLWYGSCYVLGAQADGVDTWGDPLGGSSQIGWDAQYVGDNGAIIESRLRERWTLVYQPKSCLNGVQKL
jgi:hypothetical protein